MKKFEVTFWICLGFITNSFSQASQNDLKSFRLNGKVSTLLEMVETCPSVVDEDASALNCQVDSIKYIFNKSGKLVSTIKKSNRNDYFYDESQRVVLIKEFEKDKVKYTTEFQYDQQGNLVEKLFSSDGYTTKTIVKTVQKGDSLYRTNYKKDADGQLKKDSEEVFSKEGLKIKHTLFDSEEKTYLLWIYTYNNQGHQVKLERYEWWNGRKKCSVEIYQPNNNGDPAKTEYYGCNGLTDGNYLTNDYTFDRHKNWTLKKTSGSDVITETRREYTYY